MVDEVKAATGGDWWCVVPAQRSPHDAGGEASVVRPLPDLSSPRPDPCVAALGWRSGGVVSSMLLRRQWRARSLDEGARGRHPGHHEQQ
jgi:hypothetical protein